MEYLSLNTLSHYLQKLVSSKLWVKVLVALALGVIAGVMLSPNFGWVSKELSTVIGNWLSLPGKLFLKMVQMIMIPLIFTSIISGIVGTSGEQLKKMGVRILLYFIFTTAVSISLGVFLVSFFKPGASIFRKGAFKLSESQVNLIDNDGGSSFFDIPNAISNLLPENPLASMVSGEMLSIVIFSIIIGIAITQLTKKEENPITSLLYAVQEICMTIVSWAMRLVPYAVFGLIAQLISGIGIDSLAGIGFYVGVVILGLAILLIFYMLLLVVFGRINPFTFMKNIVDVQLLAFSTTSSAAVMPLSIKTANEKLGVSPQISNFIVPIGATINMDGTALFQCISTIFIAQAYGIEISLVNIGLIMVTIVAASIGTPSIPGGGVVVLASVLQSANIPTEGIVIIIGVERVLGMFRTAINVTGDLTACVLFNRWLK
ncbi:MAG: dicarboxylate/amino acid:cation symporter [Vicingaceae bacterium]|nr:dicarboxylate/amino acid:cation symporter [Vicingaceae bacterium]